MVKLWLVSTALPCKEISKQEQLWADNLSNLRRKQYVHSRSYIRYVLSKLFDKPPLEIPLYAPPSKPLKLSGINMGFISISHCKHYLLVAWSKFPIGVDFEMTERSDRVYKLINKFIHEDEKYLFLSPREKLNLLAMKLWTLKEAAVKYYGHEKKSFLIDWICDLRNKTVNYSKSKIIAPFKTLKFLNFQIAVVSQYLNEKFVPMICFIDK